MDYTALAAEIAKPAYAGMSDAETADALNAPTVEGWRAVDTSDVVAVLILLGKSSALESDHVDAKDFARAVAKFQAIHLEDPRYLAWCEGALNRMVAASLLSADDKAALLALGRTLVSPASLIGCDGVNVGDIAKARAL